MNARTVVAVGWVLTILVVLAALVTIVVLDDPEPAAPSPPPARTVPAVEACQEIVDAWVAEHAAVVEVPVVCVPGELIVTRGGWYDHEYAFVCAYENGEPIDVAYVEYVTAHEVGHAWQDRHVDLVAVGWHARRPGLDPAYTAHEDYADVFAYALGYDWRDFWPDRPIPPVDPALVETLRAEALLP